jgi:hypothetical protein
MKGGDGATRRRQHLHIEQETEMRKVHIIAAGVATLAAFTVQASAEQMTCNQRMTYCEESANEWVIEYDGITKARAANHECTVNFSQCFRDGSWGRNFPKGTYNGDPNAPDNQLPSKVVGKVSYANGTNPDGTPKLTSTPPSGGNGKYTTVALPDGSTVQVAQGIPGGAYYVQNGRAVPFEKVIGGVRYNVSSEGYAAVAKNIAPGIEAKANAQSAIDSHRADIRDHRTDPKPAPAGGPPPAAPPGTVSAPPATGGTPGPVVRDHRPGGNAANTTVAAKPATVAAKLATVTAKPPTAAAKPPTVATAKVVSAGPAAMARSMPSASHNDHNDHGDHNDHDGSNKKSR